MQKKLARCIKHPDKSTSTYYFVIKIDLISFKISGKLVYRLDMIILQNILYNIPPSEPAP